MNLLNKILAVSILGLIIILVCGCESDDEMIPTPTPLMDFRVTGWSTIIDIDDQVVETTTVSYDGNNRFEGIIDKNEYGVTKDSTICSYNGNDVVCNTYQPISNNTAIARTLEVNLNNDGQMMSVKVTKFDLQSNIKTKDFTYLDNRLIGYVYKEDFVGNGTFDLTNEGTINWEGDQLQSIVEHTFSSSISLVDSTLFEYDGELISLYRTLRSDDGGEFNLVQQYEYNYEDELIVSAYIQEFFTDDNGFTFPVSQATNDLYAYNEEDLIATQYGGSNRTEFTYEMGAGNFGIFSCLDETTHLCFMEVLPRIW